MTRSPSKPLLLVALLVASFVINLDTTLVNVALPTLTTELGTSNSQLQWVVDAYNLVFAALLLSAGSLSDRLGRKGMLMAGLLVFGVSSFIGGYAGSPGELIAARAVMGFGAAMTFPATLALLTAFFTSRKERALSIGLWGATAGVAIALGPIVGGFLLEHYQWGSIFFVLGPVSLIVIAAVALFVPKTTNRAPARLDYPGLVLSGAFMALLVYTIIEAPHRGWAAPGTLLGFLGAMVLLVAFVISERRAREPMLDVALFKDLRFSAASFAVTASFFTLLGFIFLITQYFQFIRSYSALSAGVHLLPVAGAVAIGSILGTRLAVLIGTKAIVTAGLVLQTIFYFWVAATLTPTLGYGVIAVQMVVYGLGMGLTSAPATESIMGAVRADQAGVGSAINDSTRLLGGTLGVAVIGSVFATVYGSRLGTTLPATLPPQLAETAHQSAGAALRVVRELAAQNQTALASGVHEATINAFDRGLSTGSLVAAAAAAIGALFAVAFLPSHPPQQTKVEDAPIELAGNAKD
ncbi:DHA2 family efflux MFS transporter permease subunit [Kribbella sp. NPDC049584]|uniref:DHA2 family efflux MFS transporter permease subunit n=1 Tax=Kribbella sp. NPDC049584 TaxID=3154833 RepID=UPI0034458FD9